MTHDLSVSNYDLTNSDGTVTPLVRLVVDGDGGTVMLDLAPEQAIGIAATIADRADAALNPNRPEVIALVDSIDAQTPTVN